MFELVWISILQSQNIIALAGVGPVYKYRTKTWSSLSSLYLQIDGLVQDCSNSIAYALELLQSYTKPSKYPGI